MTKVIFIINSLGSGGAERFLVALANYFSNTFSIEILTLSKESQGCFYPLSKDIKVHYLDIDGEKPGNPFAYGYRILKRMLRLRKIIKQIQPQVVISFMDLTNIATLILTRWFHIPVLVAERNDPKFHKIPWALRGLRLWVYRYAQYIAVQTKSAAQYFPKSLQPNIVLTPNPVATPPIPTRTFKKTEPVFKTIITLGRLDPQKDHPTLIKAFAKIHPEFPDWKIGIYGEGPDRQHLKDLICHLGLNQHVILAGATKDIWSVLSKADIFVFPSRYEGFPNALCEAMSIGLPVIASNVTGNKDVVQHDKNGLLFEAGDIDKLAKLMKGLIQDTKKREALGLEAQKITQQYPPEKMFAIWEKMIRDAVG